MVQMKSKTTKYELKIHRGKKTSEKKIKKTQN